MEHGWRCFGPRLSALRRRAEYGFHLQRRCAVDRLETVHGADVPVDADDGAGRSDWVGDLIATTLATVAEAKSPMLIPLGVQDGTWRLHTWWTCLSLGADKTRSPACG